jgi:hypothetical protein
MPMPMLIAFVPSRPLPIQSGNRIPTARKHPPPKSMIFHDALTFDVSLQNLNSGIMDENINFPTWKTSIFPHLLLLLLLLLHQKHKFAYMKRESSRHRWPKKEAGKWRGQKIHTQLCKCSVNCYSALITIILNQKCEQFPMHLHWISNAFLSLYPDSRIWNLPLLQPDDHKAT